MRSVVPLLAVLALAGCAATSVPHTSELRQVDAKRVVALPKATSAAPAVVRVTRDIGYIGSAVDMHISLNGKKIAALAPAEYVEFQVDPGDYLLSAIPTDIFNGRHQTVVEASWKQGGSYNYRVGIDANMAVNLSRLLPGETAAKPQPAICGPMGNSRCY
jgi:hypothetical protein